MSNEFIYGIHAVKAVFDVTVFESMPKAGGWLRYGIPEYRLPKDILVLPLKPY